MMKPAFTAKASIRRDFMGLATCIAFVTFVLAGWFSYRTYVDQQTKILTKLKFVASRIERSLIDDIAYTTYQMEYIGKQIVKRKDQDLAFVEKLLSTYRLSYKSNVAVSWNMFSWVNEQSFMVANSDQGILEKPIDMSFREYFKKTKIEPFEIFFSYPTYGVVTHQYLIPAAMGVVNAKGKYIGSVTFGFDIASFHRKFQALTEEEGVQFLVYYKELPTITSASLTTEKIDVMTKQFKKKSASRSSGILSLHSFWYPQKDYAYFRTLEHYPFTIVTLFDAQKTSEAFWKNLPWRIGEYLCLSLAAIGCLVLLYRKVVRPVERLSLAAKTISEGVETDLPLSGVKEIDTLAEQLNQTQIYMLALKEAHAEIKRHSEEIEQALRLKTELVNNVSHEVRIPIQAIKAMIEHLGGNWHMLVEKERHQIFTRLDEATDRLVTFVTNLLSVAALKSGQVSFQKSLLDLRDLVEEALLEWEILAAKRGVTFKKTVPEVPVWVMGDQERLNEVIRNLLSNALKFMDQGTIELILEPTSYRTDTKETMGWALKVKDQGPGIAESDLKRIFESFIQGTSSSRKTTGTGLGLSISQHIMWRHEGEITVENNKGEKGATFTCLFPKINPSDSLISTYIAKAPTMSNEPSSAPAPQVTEITPIHVVLVDDEPFILESIPLLLLHTRYKMTCFGNRAALMEYLTEQPRAQVDMILLDVMMGEEYGIDILKEIRNLPKWQDIPVILQTGAVGDAAVEQCLEPGKTEVLHKPFKKQQLLEALDRIKIVKIK